jgi:AAHS family 4-hydroxybenzoate transporter-like MFS transporter
VTKGREPEVVAATLRRLNPGTDVRATDRFVLLDEPAPAGCFRFTDLFRGRLAVITPLLWLGFIVSSLAIYFSSSWTPIVLESLDFPRATAANATALAGVFGAAAGLSLMRFTDRFGARAVAVYPAVAVPVLLMQGFGLTPLGLFLAVNVIGSMLISGGHYGTTSLAGIFYPSSIRATGAGWAAAVAKVGAVLGPIIGAVVLSSDLPVIRCYALLAGCPAVLFACVIGIHFALRSRQGAPANAILYSDPSARRPFT